MSKNTDDGLVRSGTYGSSGRQRANNYEFVFSVIIYYNMCFVYGDKVLELRIIELN